MSSEPESFLARWSRRKRAAEREAVGPAERTEAEARPLEAKADASPVTGRTTAPAPASSVPQEGQPPTAIPLPPIDSLDGLRSDYQAFFQQPVDEELRHAALKKLFSDAHFNQMDMLDVYVDDYTQFEPLPATLRARLPSARDFLLDSERAALESDVAPAGDRNALGSKGADDAQEIGGPTTATGVEANDEGAPGLEADCPPVVAPTTASPTPQESPIPANPGVATGSNPASSSP